MNYSDDVMAILRQRRGLEADDTSEDKDILGMSPKTAFRNLVAWTLGNPDWATQFEDWVEQAGGVIVWPAG